MLKVRHMAKTAILALGLTLAVSALATASAMASEVKFVKANGLTIGYTEQGKGQPLVLIHGGGLSSRMWGGQVEALAANYRVIMPDTRGHGVTDNPDHRFGYRLLADDVAAFCKALKLEKPILMGYSDGGIIAMTVGIFHPDLPKALVLGGAVPPADKDDVTRYMEGMNVFYAPVGAKPAPLTDADLDAMYAADKEGWDFMKAMHAKPGEPDYWRSLMKDVWATWMDPREYGYSSSQIKQIQVPTLVLVGDRDEFFGVPAAVRFYQLLPAGELAVIPHAGHAFFRARPQLMYVPVLDFLNRVVAPAIECE